MASDDSWRNKRTEDVGTTKSVFAGRLLWMGDDSLLLPGLRFVGNLLTGKGKLDVWVAR